MRGSDFVQGAMFSYVDLEDRIPAAHPLRKLKIAVDAILVSMSTEFDRRYSRIGRPSIPPERLLPALLLQVLYSIRSERQLMEQLDYNLLFRWFVGPGIDDDVRVPTVFTKNRDRLLNTGMSRKVMAVSSGKRIRREFDPPDQILILLIPGSVSHPPQSRASRGRAAAVGRPLPGRWHAGEG